MFVRASSVLLLAAAPAAAAKLGMTMLGRDQRLDMDVDRGANAPADADGEQWRLAAQRSWVHGWVHSCLTSTRRSVCESHYPF